nr:hypothetical protein CFP56_20635 [Quercus suber]
MQLTPLLTHRPATSVSRYASIARIHQCVRRPTPGRYPNHVVAAVAAVGDRAASRSVVAGGRARAALSTSSPRSPCYKSARSSSSATVSAPAAFPVSHTSMQSRVKPSKISLRSATTMSAASDTYEAVVVGAGPAGVTCVGNLLERKVEPILWVDDSFNGGRVNNYYREVPSNTKVGLFVDFATAVAPFRKIVNGVPSRSRWDEPSESDGELVSGKSDKLHDLRQLDQTKGCTLAHAADMIVMLTEGLKKTPGITTRKGKVTGAVLDEGTGTWTVALDSADGASTDVASVQSKRLILCTGSHPTERSLPVSGPKNLDLDVTLSPTRLSEILSPLGPTTVSVIGASHSAILVLRNLYHLASSAKPDLKVQWFTRHALRYAEYMDGWILRDNTGLKGEAAVWAKENLEPEAFQQSDVRHYLTAISYEKEEEEEVLKRNLPSSDFIVQAIGYARNPIPQLQTRSGQIIEPEYDHERGSFTYSTPSGEASKLPGVYGAGIAYPQRVRDPYGNVEYAVGFFKFMKYVKQVSGDWN